MSRLTEQQTANLFTLIRADADLRGRLTECARLRAGDERGAVNFLLAVAQSQRERRAEPWAARLLAILDHVDRPAPAPEPQIQAFDPIADSHRRAAELRGYEQHTGEVAERLERELAPIAPQGVTVTRVVDRRDPASCPEQSTGFGVNLG